MIKNVRVFQNFVGKIPQFPSTEIFLFNTFPNCEQDGPRPQIMLQKAWGPKFVGKMVLAHKIFLSQWMALVAQFAAGEDEITFDPDEIIENIEQVKMPSTSNTGQTSFKTGFPNPMPAGWRGMVDRRSAGNQRAVPC